MRPEDTQACVKRDIEAERRDLPDEIYLIPESDGQYGEYWSWSEEPAPSDEHVPEEAVKYVRESKLLNSQVFVVKDDGEDSANGGKRVDAE